MPAYFELPPRVAVAVVDLIAFKLGTVSGGFTHSTEFALVDRRGFIRGYYDAEEGESLAPLIAAIRRLAQEQA